MIFRAKLDGLATRDTAGSGREGFPFLREFLPHPKQVIDLTLDSDEDDDDDDDAVEVS